MPHFDDLCPQARRDDQASGFSLIESLFALLTFFVLSIGIVPMFTRAMANNDEGKSYLDSTNFSRSLLEEFRDLPFDSPRLAVPGGSNELVTNEYWNPNTHTWNAGAAPAGVQSPWTRTVRVQQFSSADFADDGQLNNPLDGGSTLDFVHLKMVTVSIDSTREGGPLGTGKAITVQLLKTY